MSRVAIAIGLLAAACAETIHPEPVGDYTTWKRLDVRGPAPGHGTSYRIIYANSIAADPAHDFVRGYADGSIVVKEIRDDDDGQPGKLRYVALMRRGLDDPTLADQGHWLFSMTPTPGGAETHADFCWDRCHVAAPYLGAWYDYRQ